MKKFLLRKIIMISFFLTISFIIEIVINKTIFQSHCNETLLKLEFLPIILIGFLFGFKFSFFSNLLYIFFHTILEFAITEHQHEILGTNIENDNFLKVGLLFFVFIFPYLAYSVSGFFYHDSKKHLVKYQNIIKSLIFISLIQIISYFLFTIMIYRSQNIAITSPDLLSSNFLAKLLLQKLEFKVIGFIFIYYLASMFVTNITLGIFLYFLNPILKENIKFFDTTVNIESNNKKANLR